MKNTSKNSLILFTVKVLKHIGIILFSSAILLRPIVPGLVPFQIQNVFIDQFLIISFLFLLFFTIYTKKDLYLPIGFKIFGIFILINCIGFFFSPDKYSSYQIIKLFVFLYIIYFTSSSLLEEDYKKVLLFLALSTAVIVSLYGIYQYHRGLNITRKWIKQHPQYLEKMGNLKNLFLNRLNANEAFSTFITSNSFGIYTTMFLLFSITLLPLLIKEKQIFLSIFLIGLFGYSLFITHSFGSMLTLGVILPFIVYKKINAIKNSIKLILIVLCTLILSVGIVNIKTYLKRSASVRIEYWKAGIRMANEHLVKGVGPGCFGDYYTYYKTPKGWEVQKAHNNYLQILCENGIFGFIIFLYFLIRVLRFTFFSLDKNSVFQTDKKRLWPIYTGIIFIAIVGDNFLGLLPYERTFHFILYTLTFGIAFYIFIKLTKILNNKNLDILLKKSAFWSVMAMWLHSFIDFDLYVPGISYTVFLMLGCIVPTVKIKMDYRKFLVGIWGVILFIGIYALWIYPRFVINWLYLDAKKYEKLSPQRTLQCYIQMRKYLPASDKVEIMIVNSALECYKNGIFMLKGVSTRYIAIEAALKTIKANPVKAANYKICAETLLFFDKKTSTIKKAIKLYKEAIKRYTLKPPYYLRCALLFYTIKDYSNAKYYAKKALEIEKYITDERCFLNSYEKKIAYNLINL